MHLAGSWFAARAALCFFFAATLLCSCQLRPQTIEVETPDHKTLSLPIKDTLRLNLTTEPPTLDFNKTADTVSALILQNLMEGLVNYDFQSATFALKPGLAKTWTASDHAKKWSFELRDDVTWTDGVPFTAQQIVDSWKRLISAETAAEYASSTFGIKNAKAYNQGKLKDFSQVGVKAMSATRLEVELERPMSYFPYLLTNPVMFPIRADVIEKYGATWTEPGHIQTLGAYKLAAWQHDRDIVLERNDSYYGEKARTRYVMGYMIVEQATALNLFEADRLDVVWHLASAELRMLRKKPEYKEVGLLQTYFYGINTHRPPMNDARVRRAIGMAIDRAKICKILGGGEQPLSGWVPPGVASYNPDVGLKFDPVQARALLKEAGYSAAKPLTKITLSFNTNEDHQRIAEAVQAQLKENLGVTAEIKNEEWKMYLNHLQTSPPPMYRFGWLADYPDADNFMSVMTSASDNNRTGFKDKAYDDLIDQAAGETNALTRKDLYTRAQKLMLEQAAPVLPLFVSMNHLVVNKRVLDLPITPLDMYYFKTVRLAK